MIRDGDQLGIMSVDDAQRLADDADLDLVEVAPTADPPVCRLLDYGKFKYEQAKRERESRRGSRSVELREVRLGSVKISQHDLDFKSKTARKLLGGGDKVKISVRFRAREITHPEVGRELLDKFYAMIEDVAKIDRNPNMEGRSMSMIVEPAKQEPAATEPAADASPTNEPAAQPVSESA